MKWDDKPESRRSSWSFDAYEPEGRVIRMAHGAGGKLSSELVERFFLPAFRTTMADQLADASVLVFQNQTLLFSTDSFVVKPLTFPGGSIGELAVNGTVNDLATSGAQPLYLSAAFIIEEGFPFDELAEIVERMSEAAMRAGVMLVAGDTKVVAKGRADGLFINTSGIGVMADGVPIIPNQAEVGDVVIVSGTLGDHGMALAQAANQWVLGGEVVSDTAALNGLVGEMLEATREIHVLRDPTRGGVAAKLNLVARASRVGIAVDEEKLPVKTAVWQACELAGVHPLAVANEGKLVAVVPEREAEKLVAAMRRHPLGEDTAVIGRVVADHRGEVMLVQPSGKQRVVV